MSPFRYLAFVAVGVVVASLLFMGVSFIVNANFDESVNMVERWIVRATCHEYELEGTVRDTQGRPVPFAVIEASYPGERLSTRSAPDGRFKLAAAEAMCEQRPPRSVELVVLAEDYRPKRMTLAFEDSKVEVRLDSRDFRP